MSKDKTPYEQFKDKFQFIPNYIKAGKAERPTGEPIRPTSKSSPLATYWSNLPGSLFFAWITVPAEALTLNRIFHYFNYPNTKPISYLNIMKEFGVKGLYKGAIARVSYCTAGTFTTLYGLHLTNDNWLLTTALKNPLNLPLSLFSNAQQSGYNLSKTLSFVGKGVLDPVGNATFFIRNGAGSLCWALGLEVRDRTYQILGESNTQIPTAAGILTGGAAATLMNAWVKPFFTGKNSVTIKLAAANALIKDCWPLGMREGASAAIFFFNKPFTKQKNEKKLDEESNNETKIKP